MMERMLRRVPRRGAVFLGLILCLGVFWDLKAVEIPDDLIYGRIEEALLWPEKKPIRIKMDTGAKRSSIDARNMSYHERAGKRWVRFDVFNNKGRRLAHLEREVIGMDRIRKRPSDGPFEADSPSAFTCRPTVRLTFCIHSKIIDLTANLADRSGFLFPVILGRDDMRRLKILVNPRLSMTQAPRCVNVGSP